VANHLPFRTSSPSCRVTGAWFARDTYYAVTLSHSHRNIMQQERIELLRPQMRTARALTVRRYGNPGKGPKAYLQAALHADELPGVIALHHLEKLLQAAEDNGEIKGEIVIVPFANPIGLTQYVDMKPLGRFEMRTGQNFNRHYPD